MSFDVLDALRARANEPARLVFSDPAQNIEVDTLAARVGGLAAALAEGPDTIGILAPSGIEWVIADLAGWAAGKTVVPLPHFFSDEQIGHIVREAGIGAIFTDETQSARLVATGVQRLRVDGREAELPGGAMAGQRIVYTSGSSGTPKGVLLGPEQIRQTSGALVAVTGAGSEDRHLSVLPFSMLLEAICGIYVPVLAGASTVIAPHVIGAPETHVADALGQAVLRHRPSTMVLVPQLLGAWIAAVSSQRIAVPDSLRFVATGGAQVPEELAAQAWQLGIPVYEGYGLTECGSVVAVNAPGARRAGSVGRPLPGCKVGTTPDGEIVVASPSVASGYLNRDDGPHGGVWHTGDIGRLDDEGFLYVSGRKDSLVVTANGRNISPEWIEHLLVADFRIGRAVVMRAADGALAALLEPSPAGLAWAREIDGHRLRLAVDMLLAAAPGYAIPRHLRLLPPGTLAAASLLTATGKPRRSAIAAAYAASFRDHPDTMETRHAVL